MLKVRLSIIADGGSSPPRLIEVLELAELPRMGDRFDVSGSSSDPAKRTYEVLRARWIVTQHGGTTKAENVVELDCREVIDGPTAPGNVTARVF